MLEYNPQPVPSITVPELRLWLDTEHRRIALAVTGLRDAITALGPSLSGFWRFDSATAAADPGQGELRFNNATPASVTAIYINEVSEPGTDAERLLGLLAAGDELLIQQQNDSARFIRVTVASAATDNGAWFTIPVTVIDSGTLPVNGEDLNVILLGGAGVSSFDTGANYTMTGDWTFSGSVSLEAADGSLSAPGIRFSADTNTGIARSSADQIDLITGGAYRVLIQAGSNPLALIGSDATGDCYLSFYENDASTRKGYLGYGNAADNTFFVANEEASATVVIQTAATTRMTISTSSVTNTLPLRGPDGSNSAPTYSFANDTDTGMWNNVANEINLTISTVNKLTIAAALITLNETVTMTEALTYSGINSPTLLTASQNNYNPSSLDARMFFRLTSNAAVNITGLVAQVTGRILRLCNVNAAGGNNITLTNEDAASTAANRFAIAANIVLVPNSGVTIWYDGTSSRWRKCGGI